VVAIGDGPVRRRIATELEARGLTAAVLVHPTVTIGSRVRIGGGSMICALTSVSTNIDIGRHVLLNVNSSVGHDAVLDDYATVGPQCAVTGGVRIGTAATLGSRCAILPRLTVGAGAMVPAGSVVVRDVPPGATWGLPTRRPAVNA
jgi:sugar O-acyltransferase (sialic acid O-acetyltransferase NeuD family)